jgi:hypothetical protein
MAFDFRKSEKRGDGANATIALFSPRRLAAIRGTRAFVLENKNDHLTADSKTTFSSTGSARCDPAKLGLERIWRVVSGSNHDIGAE